MGYPAPQAGPALEAAGVRAVLTLTQRDIGDLEGIEQLHEPLVDFGTPSVEQLDRCVDWIDAQRAAGRAVAVHCMAGIGRTGTVLAAWLIAQGATAEEAAAEVRRLRPGSIETAGQRAMLNAFEAARRPATETG